MYAPRMLAGGIAALATLLFSIHTALAASATWRSIGTDGNWHNLANWNPVTVPNGPTDVATFGFSDAAVPFATTSANTEVDGIVFTPGASAFSISTEATFTISGSGITNDSAALQAFSAFGGGVIRFQNSAMAGNANVVVQAGSGSTVFFTGSSTGGSARLGANSTGVVDISGLTSGGMTAGRITDNGSGASFFRLGSKTLTVGGSNLDAPLTAAIADGGAAGGIGGSIVKVGTGTMTYAGGAANTYTGTTFVNEGTLVLNKDLNIDAIRGPLVVGDGLGAASTAALRLMGPENIHDSQPVTVSADGRFITGDSLIETIGSLTVNKGSILFTVSSELHVQGPLAVTGGTVGPSGAFWLLDSTIQATSDSGGAAATVSAAVQFASPFAYTFTVNDGAGATDLLISGNIFDSAPASIVKAGAGVMLLSGNNTYRGPTTITAGTLSISSDANLGTPPVSPTANRLVFDGGMLQITGGGVLNANRGMTLNAAGGSVEVAAGAELTYNGGVEGTGNLTKTGPGHLVFGGLSANTYTGATNVNDGTLTFAKSGNQNSLASLVIGDGLGAANSAVVGIFLSNQIFDAAPVTIHPDGLLSITDSAAEGIGSLTATGGNVQIGSVLGGSLSVNSTLTMSGGMVSGAGTLNLLGSVTATSDGGSLPATIASKFALGGATRTFTVNDGPDAVDLNISGVISNGGITKTGAGTLALAGANTYSGPTTIIAGTLIVTGSISGSTTVIANGATLQGAGTTGPLTINSGGYLMPGLSVGTLNTGNLALNSGSTSSFELAVANVVGSGVNDLVAVRPDVRRYAGDHHPARVRSRRVSAVHLHELGDQPGAGV